jgi:hypothetical protein
VEFGLPVANDNLINQKAFADGNENRQSNPSDAQTTAYELLVGLQLTH